jgi:hypothetical protein
MCYTITLLKDMAHYTAYDGASLTDAQKAVDMLRSVLILARGTADIFVTYDKDSNVPLYHVFEGQAAPTGFLKLFIGGK